MRRKERVSLEARLIPFSRRQSVFQLFETFSVRRLCNFCTTNANSFDKYRLYCEFVHFYLHGNFFRGMFSKHIRSKNGYNLAPPITKSEKRIYNSDNIIKINSNKEISSTKNKNIKKTTTIILRINNCYF